MCGLELFFSSISKSFRVVHFRDGKGKLSAVCLRFGLYANYTVFKEIDTSHWFFTKIIMRFGICSLFPVAYLLEGYPHYLTSQRRPCALPCSES